VQFNKPLIEEPGRTGPRFKQRLLTPRYDPSSHSALGVPSNANSVISNSFLGGEITFSASKSGTNVSAKVTGIWFSGETAVSGSIKKAK